MTEFSKLEARLDAALGVLAAGGKTSKGDAANLAALEGQVADLKKETATGAAQVKSVTEQLETARGKIARLKEVVGEQKDSVLSCNNEAANLKESQADAIAQRDKAREYTLQLKEANFELRRKNEEMVGDPELINSNLEREIAQLKEQHDIDLEEVNNILARLTPLVEGN